MNQVYVYRVGDVFVYFRDDEIRLIVDVSESEMVENGIEVAGVDLFGLENDPTIEAGIDFETMDVDQEKILSERLAKYIKDNDL